MSVTDSVIPMASQLGLASGSVPGLEPESVPVWEQDSDSVPAWVPESVWARESGLPTVPGLESVSDLVRDRTLHRLQIPSALSWR